MIGTDIQDQQYPSLLFLDIDTTQMVLSMKRGEILKLCGGSIAFFIGHTACGVVLIERTILDDSVLYVDQHSFDCVMNIISTQAHNSDGVKYER